MMRRIDLLGLDVRLRDRRLVGLERDLEVALVVAADDFGAGACRIERCRKKLRMGHGACSLL